MSGPWEDFAGGTATATNTGPWEDFKGKGGPWEDFKGNAQKVGKTPELPLGQQFMQGIQRGKELVAPLANIPGMVAEKASDLLGKGLARIGGMKELPPVTPEGVRGVAGDIAPDIRNLVAGGVLPQAQQLFTGMTGIPPSPPPQTPASVPLGIGQLINTLSGNPELGRILGFSPEAGETLKQAAAQVVAEQATPANALLAGVGAGLGPQALRGMGVLFGTPALAQGAAEAGKVAGGQGDPARVLSDLLMGVTMVGGAAVAPEAATPRLGPYQQELRQGGPEMPFLMPNRPGIPMPDRRIPLQLPEKVPSSAIPLPDVPASYQERPPLIGQRPLTIEQPILQLREEKPGYIVAPESRAIKGETLPPQAPQEGSSYVPPTPTLRTEAPGYVPKPGTEVGKREVYTSEAETPTMRTETGRLYSGAPIDDFDRYQDVQKALLASYRSGNVDAYRKAFAENEAIKNRQPVPGMPPVAPQGKAALRPAVNIGGRIIKGAAGETHADILQRNGINPDMIPHEDARRGFIDITKPDQFLDRKTAEKQAGVVGTAKAGGLDSQDLIGKEGGRSAIPELRTSSISETQPSGGVQKVGEEVRERAEGARETQGGQEETPGLGTSFFSGMPMRLEKEKPRGELEGFWMHFAGNLIPETSDYQVAREVVEGEPKGTKGEVTESGAKSFEQEMASRGFAKVIRQGDTYFVDSNASTQQLAGIRNQAKAEGREVVTTKLYSGAALEPEDINKFAMTASRALRDPNEPKTTITATEFPLEKVSKARETAPFTMFGKDQPHRLYSGAPIFDPKLWSEDKEAVERMQAKFAARVAAKDPDAIQAESQVKQVASIPAEKLNSAIGSPFAKVLDYFYGHETERRLPEGFRHIEAKWNGYAAPAHVAASERVANKMIEFASADTTMAIDPARAGKGYKDRVMKEWIEAGVADSLYKYGKAGEDPMLGGQATDAIAIQVPGIGHKSLRVRRDLMPEVKQVLRGGERVKNAGMQKFLDLATTLQIIGPTDLVYHSANMFASILKSPGKSGNFLVDQLLRQPGVKHVDAIARIGWNLYKTISDSPEIRAELYEISRMGALRAEEQGGRFSTGRLIRVVDRAGRRARNQMFDNLVEQGLAKDTVLDRREFINKMGQYNPKLMSEFQSKMQRWFSQFVVAGRTFNRNGIQSILASNEFRSASPTAFAKAKLSNLIALSSTAVVLPVVVNSIITGKPFGRAGTPVGKIDTGKDSEDGRPITFDPMQSDLSRRGARITGIEEVVEGVKAGREPLDILARAGKAIALGYLHPWLGPPARVGEAFLTTSKTGTAGDAFREAVSAVNPFAASVVKDIYKTAKGGTTEVGGTKEAVGKLGGAAGVGVGKFLSNIEQVEKTTGKPVGELSLEQRILAERQVKKEKPPASEMDQAKAASRAIQLEARRGVELKDSLDRPTRQWIDSRKLILPGYDNKLDFGKTQVYLNKEEGKRLDTLVKQEYLRSIEALKEDKEFDSLPTQEKQEVFHRVISGAAHRARGMMKEELDKANPSSNAQKVGNTRKKRRYSVFQQP